MDWYERANTDRLRQAVDLLFEPPAERAHAEDAALSIARENHDSLITLFSHFLDWQELESGSLERANVNVEDQRTLAAFVRAVWDLDPVMASLAMLPPEQRSRRLAEHASLYGLHGQQLAELERWRVGPARNLKSALKEKQ